MLNSLNYESLGKKEVPVDVIIPTFDQKLGVLVEVGRSLGPNSNEFVAPDNPELRRLIQIRNPSPNDLSRIHKLIKDNGLYDPSMFAEAAQIPIHESIHTGLKLIIGPLKNNNIISRWENESYVRAIQSTIPGFPEHADNYSELKLRHPTLIDQFLADPIRVVVDFPRCISEFVSWKNQR